MLQDLASKPGLTGAHLLITDTPETSTPTTEQKIRGSDGTADWVVLLSGYDADVVRETVSQRFSAPALQRVGAQDNSTVGNYTLSFGMTALDVARA